MQSEKPMSCAVCRNPCISASVFTHAVQFPASFESGMMEYYVPVPIFQTIIHARVGTGINNLACISKEYIVVVFHIPLPE